MVFFLTNRVYNYKMNAKEKKEHGLKGRARPQDVRDKISRAHKGRPKKYTTWLKGRKGADHPSYKHGKGANREYDHEKNSAWIQGVKRATNFKCFITGRDHDLECHHLIGFQHEETRYLIQNGVAICKEIHVEFHNQYGRGYSTPEQFEEFCTKNYSITVFPWRQGNHNPSIGLWKEQEKIVKLTNKKANDFVELVSSRGHQIVEGSYLTNSSLFKIHCLKHKIDYQVKAGNYKKSVFGIQCCSSEKQGMVVAIANRKRKRKT